jgi:aspartate kinase
MSILVQKYGGSSVADVDKIGKVADKVVAAKRAGHDVVVTVSAMGKKTDELIALAKSVDPAPPRRELDMLVSTGERVSMALLSIAIHARGEDAISFTGSQSGIITNDRHFDARIIEVRPHRIEDELARGKIVIVAGYQGMSYRREITTLGRGGTDTTAVALAAALGAERCEIYSDVDGVYSADPRVVDDPVHLPQIDLAALQEMAEAGAKVLNAQAVEWARRAKIAIYARKTADDVGPSGHPEKQTVAHEAPEGRVRAVVGQGSVVFATVGTRDFEEFVAAARAISLPYLDACVTGDDASCAIPLLNVPDWDACKSTLEERLGSRLALRSGCAVVSLVGHGLHAELGRFLGTVRASGATPRAVFAGPLRLAATIDAEHLDTAQRAVHAAFVR